MQPWAIPHCPSSVPTDLHASRTDPSRDGSIRPSHWSASSDAMSHYVLKHPKLAARAEAAKLEGRYFPAHGMPATELAKQLGILIFELVVSEDTTYNTDGDADDEAASTSRPKKKGKGPQRRQGKRDVENKKDRKGKGRAP